MCLGVSAGRYQILQAENNLLDLSLVGRTAGGREGIPK